MARRLPCGSSDNVIAHTARMARRFNTKPDEGVDVRLEFTFDSRRQSDGTAGTIYKMFRTLPEWANTSIFDKNVGFDGTENPRLEMPNLLARAAMKELDRKITNAPRDPRKSYQTLHDAELSGRWPGGMGLGGGHRRPLGALLLLLAPPAGHAGERLTARPSGAGPAAEMNLAEGHRSNTGKKRGESKPTNSATD